MRLSDLTVLVRGGGEMGSGIAHRLHQSHMRVLITETAAPTAVRRTVAFAEAVYEGEQTVEGVKAVRIEDPDGAKDVWSGNAIPLIVDPHAGCRGRLEPRVLVDAVMAKKNSSTRITDAPLVIGVGPGFTAGVNAHAVVESNRGYYLGRVIWDGSAEPDTGAPAPVGGHTYARVLRAPRPGRFSALKAIGDFAACGEVIGEVEGAPVRAEISGIVRGLIRDGIRVAQGLKIGDIDPRGERGYCYVISDKARAIGGGVLEAILHSFNGLEVQIGD
ncbi:MAG TPA: selenium-dependent molybdenum cofactor biosynthesis protein YqeB [Candidatus Eisenbacteria bacterium]|nr:selenium-dependent molybdenum cofactor biosynthesis protein YqeB [Candidatus Eisenbacteria bacterium]